MLAIYRGDQTAGSYRSAVNMGKALGLSGWSPDPGRLEDGVGETLNACRDAILASGGTLVTEFAPSDRGCSHGITGIFGRTFVNALAAAGKRVQVSIDYTVSEGRLTFGDYSFSLV